MTVHRALKELEREGVITRLVGKGTFVLKTPSAPTSRHSLVLVFPLAEVATLTTQNIYYGPILQGILSALAETGCLVQFWSLGFDQLRQIPPEVLTSRALLVFAPFEDARPVLEEWWAAGVPFVVIGASWQDASFPCVDTDNFAAAQQVVDFLVGMGHRHIALLAGRRIAPNSRDRWDGFLAALRKHGLSVPPEWLIESEMPTALSPTVQEHLRTLFKSKVRPTALFAAGYYLAAEALRLLKGEGWRVPEDISLVAFDDPPSASYLEPPLTTVRQPLVELGRRAVFKLLSLLEGQIQPTVEKLSVELVVRASVASPRNPQGGVRHGSSKKRSPSLHPH
jgi:DNA-binding LacI/PurR family transcriptional regulator